MSGAGGREAALGSRNGGDWSGRAEQLFQQQLKSVQEECRLVLTPREVVYVGDSPPGS